jgi:hypothetical protein
MEIDLPTEEDARFLGSRSVSIKGIFEPWGSGATCEECLQAVKVLQPVVPVGALPVLCANESTLEMIVQCRCV